MLPNSLDTEYISPRFFTPPIQPMAEALTDLLHPGRPIDTTTVSYLSHLSGLSADQLEGSEPRRLSQSHQTLLLSLQALSKRSQRSIVQSASCHASLRRELPVLARRAADLAQAIPCLDQETEKFSAAFGKASESDVVVRRKEALRLLGNADRLVDVMELPPLLTSAVRTNPINYTSALDLYSHVRRLSSLYPSSILVSTVLREADVAIAQMAIDLMVALKAPSLKLAAGLRTAGWLKRILPDLAPGMLAGDVLPALFLVCRIMTLHTTLSALDPLRELADEERRRQANVSQASSGGQQTERYLKRFLEIFREHSFAIISMSKGIDASMAPPSRGENDLLRPFPSALLDFSQHLVGLLIDTLQAYIPGVKDEASRDSIVTQFLYCAGSLGRLGADFGMLLAYIGIDDWAKLVKRHRMLVGRLEAVTGDNRVAGVL